ncbi:MAG: CRISPR-associated protein Cas5 [Clostridiales bacterium]|nr:CRISPR-associated protein Cas5 [Clostridiales bacterium]
MKAIRLHLKQNSANYRREETVNCRMTYPLPPYSTVIGALHKACGYTSYHPMQISVQGKYGSLKTRMFKEDCFLNRCENDRGILVKMKNPDMLSFAYDVVATAQKAQGYDFEKGITINVVNQRLLDEFRFLKRTKRRIDKHKKIIDSYKKKLKKMKSDNTVSPDELKAFGDYVKRIETVYKKYESEKYTIPYSKFRTLTKAPKYYEILCDVELIVHVVSDDNTMADIMNNICNLMAIGRGEDFVEILECVETELKSGELSFVNKVYDAYIPLNIIQRNENLKIMAKKEGIYTGGTKYLINKDYSVEKVSGGYRKRNFNKVPVLFTGKFRVKGECDGAYLDKSGGDVYSVFLA